MYLSRWCVNKVWYQTWRCFWKIQRDTLWCLWWAPWPSRCPAGWGCMTGLWFCPSQWGNWNVYNNTLRLIFWNIKQKSMLFTCIDFSRMNPHYYRITINGGNECKIKMWNIKVLLFCRVWYLEFPSALIASLNTVIVPDSLYGVHLPGLQSWHIGQVHLAQLLRIPLTDRYTGHFTSSVHVQYNDRCKRNPTRWFLWIARDRF